MEAAAEVGHGEQAIPVTSNVPPEATPSLSRSEYKVTPDSAAAEEPPPEEEPSAAAQQPPSKAIDPSFAPVGQHEHSGTEEPDEGTHGQGAQETIAVPPPDMSTRLGTEANKAQDQTPTRPSGVATSPSGKEKISVSKAKVGR